MVDVADIPDFPGQPGQRPLPGAPSAVAPVPVVLVTAPLDREYRNVALNPAAVDAYISAELAAGRGKSIQVERWSPWSPLQVQLGYGAAAGYNYARMEVGGRSWYAFLSAEYLNLADTVYRVEPDEWTTYHPTIGYSTVERGHVAVAASVNDTYGAQYLTAPEPIEAAPVRAVLSSSIEQSYPQDWTVLVISTNELRGGSGNPFWDKHVQADLIEGAARLASSATVDSNGNVQALIPDAAYPWASGGSGSTGPTLTDTISPWYSVTNPGGTIASGWAWHIANNGGRGGVDWDYNFQTFTAPGPGTVDHFDVAGVGMVVRLTLDTPAVRIDPQQPAGDQYGPIYSIWFQHCSAAVDGHADTGDVIGTSGDGYGAYPPHLHVHGVTNHSNTAGSGNRANAFAFMGDSPTEGPSVYVPKVNGAPVSTIDGVSAGGAAYLFTLDGFAQYMTIMQGAPWVTSGIVDVRLVPSWVVPAGGDANYVPAKASTDPVDPMWAVAAGIPVYVGELSSGTINAQVLNNWREAALSAVGAAGWRKLITSQYTDVMVGNGETLRSYLPEQWQTAALGFELTSGAAHGEPSMRATPIGYSNLGPQMGVDVPVGGSAGLAHSGYGLAGSNTAAQDLTPYLNAYSSHQAWLVASRNKSLAVELGLTNIQLNAGVQGISTVMGAASSAAGGAIAGGGPGAIAGAAAGGIGAAGSLATAGIQAQNAITMLDVSQNGSFDITALSLALSGEVAVASFDTWKQSLSAVSGSGIASRLASAWRAIRSQALDAFVVMPSAERVRALVSEWRRFGYMVGQAFIPPRLDVMTHWSYWQLSQATITGALPQGSRDTIARAFERGVTVWGNVAEIGTEPANEPVPGVTY